MRRELISGTITPGYSKAAYGAQEVAWSNNYQAQKYNVFKLLYDPSQLLRPGAEFYSTAFAPTFKDNGQGFTYPDGALFERKERDDMQHVFMAYTARNPERDEFEQWLIEVPERDTGQPLVEYRPTRYGSSLARVELTGVSTTPRIPMFSLVDLRSLVVLARDIIKTQRNPTGKEQRRLKRLAGPLGENLLAYISRLDYFVECCQNIKIYREE